MTSLVIYKHSLTVARATCCPPAFPDPVEGTDARVTNDREKHVSWDMQKRKDPEGGRNLSFAGT